MSAPGIPDEILDGIAARPDDTAAWEVLTDFLLEHDLPGGTLARCDLELMKGISNPELLGALAQARKERPRLPFEPSIGFDDIAWRCGHVVKFEVPNELDTVRFEAVLRAPSLRGLHHLRFDTTAGWRRRTEPGWRATRLEALLRHVTPHLRRFSLVCGDELQAVLALLGEQLPPKVERVDLTLGPLTDVSLLAGVARRARELNLDGTRLSAVPVGALEALVDSAPDCTFFLAGTWRSRRELSHPRVRWAVPEAVAWLEHEDTGVVVPLTPRRAHDFFFSPAWPELQGTLQRELMGWSAAGRAVDDGALLNFADGAWRFRRA